MSGDASAGESTADRGARPWRVLAAGALLSAGVLLLPGWLGGAAGTGAMEGLDPRAVGVGLGIFACIAFLWLSEALPLAATALLVPLLAAALTGLEPRAALAPFAHPLIFLFFGGFALASAMGAQGLDRWLAGRLVKAGRGRFLPVALLMFGATAFLSMWISNTATVALLLPLALGILATLPRGGDGHLRESRFLLLGLAYAASIGGLGTLIGSPPNGIAASQLGLSFAQWMAFGLPAVVVLLPVMVLVLALLCRPRRGLRVERPDEGEAEDFRFNRPRVLTLAVFAAAALCWIGGGWLGPRLGVESDFDTFVALSAALALLLCGVVGWREIDRGTDWSVLLLFGGGLALSNVLRDSGASLFLARQLAAAAADWPAILLAAGLVAFVIFLTELSSNTATAALLVPVFASMAGELGMDARSLVVPVALAASCAFMLPVATPPNAIVFGSGRIAQADMVRCGLVLNVLFIGLLAVLAALAF